MGSRALRSSATIAIDAQSDSASIPVLTAGHRPAARPAGGRAAVWLDREYLKMKYQFTAIVYMVRQCTRRIR